MADTGAPLLDKVVRADGMAAILEPDDLAREMAALAKAGKRTVFTNGVYDLLHSGHIAFLRQAKALGDVLVVALNTDASVTRLKGAKRPLIPLVERAKIMASLEMVDFVTAFAEDTPLEIIQNLRPTVLVKGADYTPDTIVGRDFVEGYGGTVATLPYVEGVSSSAIIERIVRAS